MVELVTYRSQPRDSIVGFMSSFSSLESRVSWVNRTSIDELGQTISTNKEEYEGSAFGRVLAKCLQVLQPNTP